MAERYIPESIRKLLNSMKNTYYDWLPSPLDGGLVYDEEELKLISDKYGINITTEYNGDAHFSSTPTYRVTVEKGEQSVSYTTFEEIPKRWPIRLRLKKQPKHKK